MDMIKSMQNEILTRKSELDSNRIDTIYFGGGTPSLLSYDELMAIFETIYSNFEVSPTAEITLEANPDDLNKAHVATLRSTPINRFSIGIQSFRDEDLEMMNRAHKASDAEYSVKTAQDAGFDNITIDLIYAIPGLSTDAWKSNLEKALSLNVPHISAYCMTIEEKTAFGKWEKSGKIIPAGDDIARDHYLYLIEQLAIASYDHYEVSNFGKPGKHSQHNTSYWKGLPYLGIGPSAHSFDGINTRRWNISNNPLYIRKMELNEAYHESEKLSERDMYNEYIMTGLRTEKGIDLTYIYSRFGIDVKKQFEEELLPYFNSEIAILENDKIKLSEVGFFSADRVASDLFLLED